jgi:hypothetical protein
VRGKEALREEPTHEKYLTGKEEPCEVPTYEKYLMGE